MRLSSGVILEILNGANPDKPVFQVINAKKIESANSVDRYRLLLSDGEYVYSHVMLAAQLNKVMENNTVPNLSVIEATRYLCNKLQGDKRVIILLDLKVLAPGPEVGERLGNPTQLNPNSIPASTTKPAEESGTNGQNATVFKPQNNNNTAISTGNTKAQPVIPPVKKPLTPGTPNSRVHSIASLTPYQNRWRIRARVTMKSNIRTWSNSKGEGKLFNCNLLDDSGEIRMTGFKEQVDKFYDMLELNKVYYISRCTLKTANKQYSNLNNDYEMTMNSETLIEPCNDDSDMPVMSFDFVKLSELEQCKPPTSVDVIGVVKVCNDVNTVVGRQSQKEIMKRDLQIVDQSGLAVALTLWGEEANKFDGMGFPIVAVKGARLSDFNGRSLSVSGSSQLIVNPDTKEAHVLRGWFESGGRDQSFSTYQSEGGSGGGQSSNWKTFLQVKSENLGQGEKADYYTAKGTVVFVKKDNCMYQACPLPDCNKKVIDQGNGQYRCEKCNREFPNHKWRMILSCNVADHTDNQWITCFQDSAECVLGLKADELGQLREKDEMQFDQVLQEALFKSYIFRMRAKVETYNDESRLKTVCVAANTVDWNEYGNQLLSQISQLGI
ncbi:replication protein A 70 kDa DNA-binding subunit [Elysia marginata]|uniref:Replication protein A subunit n=1 Tax=Elysia marginata TaxID=1093978 RepID=A0AAV4J0W2_9GAST|nr:replication protein A 70 kDa DNA-binding subunit [Elysia marginata]